jgi:hypothetical protein
MTYKIPYNEVNYTTFRCGQFDTVTTAHFATTYHSTQVNPIVVSTGTIIETSVITMIGCF